MIDTTARDVDDVVAELVGARPSGGDRLMWFYRIVRPFVTGIPRMLWRVRIVGLESTSRARAGSCSRRRTAR